MFIQHLFRDSLSIRLLVTSPRHDGSSSICSVNVQFHSPRNYCVCAKFPVALMVRHLMHAIECAGNEPNRNNFAAAVAAYFSLLFIFTIFFTYFFFRFTSCRVFWFAFVTLCPPPSVYYRCIFSFSSFRYRNTNK